MVLAYQGPEGGFRVYEGGVVFVSDVDDEEVRTVAGVEMGVFHMENFIFRG